MPISRLAVDEAKNDTLNTRDGDCGDLHFATNSEAKKHRDRWSRRARNR